MLHTFQLLFLHLTVCCSMMQKPMITVNCLSTLSLAYHDQIDNSPIVRIYMHCSDLSHPGKKPIPLYHGSSGLTCSWIVRCEATTLQGGHPWHWGVLSFVLQCLRLDGQTMPFISY